MISTAAIVTAVTAILAGILAVLIPAVSAAISLAVVNLMAFLFVLPVKLGIEAVHRRRNAK